MKTATITFHAAHNYGSALQSYALQQTIKGMGHENQIINFRTPRQIDQYNIFTKRKGFKYLVKNTAKLFNYSAFKKKHAKFEAFIKEKLSLTEKTYKSLEELKKENFEFDCYIAGSDQIWNPFPLDFDWSYYLPFVNNGKKISYAPSFGPLSKMGNNETLEKIKENLKTFDRVTVRDAEGAIKLGDLLGVEAKVVLDPTLLLEKEEWEKLLPEKRSVEGDYIFFYSLFADKEMIKMVKALSKKLKLPVVVSNFSNQYDLINGFKKRYAMGPLEFLDLIYNAKFVITSSFHGTAFSTIFEKDFLSIRGDKDARISSLLAALGLEDRCIGSVSEINSGDFLNAQFLNAKTKLSKLVAESREILKNMIVEE